MIARAPGKIVVSGAYSVLEGAPAIVAAVDRYVVADGERLADFVTDEVRQAIAAGALDRAPWFDASALRANDRKLGLGSSAAILVASLAARVPEGDRAEDLARPRIFEAALEAHRAAQHGGSGIDVAASVHGGVLACAVLDGGRLDVRPHDLPRTTTIQVFSSREASSTRGMLERVDELKRTRQSHYRGLLDRAAYAARRSLQASSVAELVGELSLQVDALAELGRAAGVPIVTDDVEALREAAAGEGASFGPSGAGGGDIAIFVGREAPSDGFRVRAKRHGLETLRLQIGARGVHWQGPTTP